MQLILVGPPGCGKGTQAVLLSQRLNLTHLATGVLLRQAVAQRTETGCRADAFMQKGELVPSEVVNQLVGDFFHSEDRPERFVMDGYPRTVDQANFFDDLLREKQIKLRGVILLDVQEEEVIRRLKKRWTCSSDDCKQTYHEESQPSRSRGICDQCGHKLIKRDDDNEKTVRHRMEVYREETRELIPHYEKRNLLLKVDGEGDVEQVYERIMRILPTRVS